MAIVILQRAKGQDGLDDCANTVGIPLPLMEVSAIFGLFSRQANSTERPVEFALGGFFL